jgi:REP element-mobilizing transposase RayT
MARIPRLNMAGFHHIVNRGVARDNVYKCDEDKDKYLEILCKACRTYKVNVHDYCLMDNHYHLLIETTSENLSLFMRQINSNYAIYFNKKYKRTGHLWQGRYKSWYIVDKKYLYDLFRYIEHNPIEAKIANKIGEYPFTLLATVLNGDLEVIPCAEHSQIKKEIEYEGIREHLEVALTEGELKELEIRQKKKIVQKEHSYGYDREKTLEEHFGNFKNREERNRAIMEALDDGYGQAEVARYLNITASAIAKVRKKFE